jgi:hypothetical protein
MNGAPFSTEEGDGAGKGVFDGAEVRAFEAEAFAQSRRAVGAVQDEDGFAITALHVDMGGAVVAGVDDDAEGTDAKDGWHVMGVAETQALGNEDNARARGFGVLIVTVAGT